MENNIFEKDNIIYKKEIVNYFSNNKYEKDKILMGKMPLVYYLYGTSFYNANLYIHVGTIKHILKKHKDISENDIINLYENLINPLVILCGSEQNTIVSILDYKSKNNINLQVPIYFNLSENNLFINAIGTVYEQNKFRSYIIKEILKHNLIAYNKKIEPYIHSLGLLLPVEEDKFSIYDDSISYTLKNVKNINSKSVYYKFNTKHKFFKPEFKSTKKEIEKVLNEMNIKIIDLFNTDTMQPYYDDLYYENIEKLNNTLIDNKISEINRYIKNIQMRIIDSHNKIL